MRLLSSFLFRLHNIPLLVAAAGILVAGAGSAELARLGGGLNYLSSSANNQLLNATPNPIQVCDGTGYGSTQLSWNVISGPQYEIRRGYEGGERVTTAYGPGQAQVGQVANNTNFYLRKLEYEWQYIRGRGWVRVAVWRTVAQVTIATTTAGCVPVSSAKPLVGVVRWDAWNPNSSLYYVPPKLFSDWDYRKPLDYNWLDSGVAGEQQIIDAQINRAADNGVDYFSFVWYPRRASLDVLRRAYELYLNSPVKNRLKFALIIDTQEVAGCPVLASGVCERKPGDPEDLEVLWESEFVPEFVNAFKDAQYVKVDGNRPVVYWIETEKLGVQPEGFGTVWPQKIQYFKDQVRAAGLGEPIIFDHFGNEVEAAAKGFAGTTSYGPSGAGMASGGQFCRSAQDAVDRTAWNEPVQAGQKAVVGITSINDHRPQLVFSEWASSNWWVDQPTYGQWENHLKNAFAWIEQNRAKMTNPPLVEIYAWNEFGENGGGIQPTRQDGTMFLDVLRTVRNGSLPATYVDTYNNDNCAIALQGQGWSNWGPMEPRYREYPQPGNYNNDEGYTGTPGDAATLVVNNATLFEVIGLKTFNRGKMEVYIDGVSQGIVDLYSPTTKLQQSLFKSQALAPGQHTIKLVNRSSPGSSSYMSFDAIKVQVQR